MSLKIRELCAADWSLIEEIFGAKGGCGGCWCMAWRRDCSTAGFKRYQGEPNRRALQSLIRKETAHGCLAFEEKRPVGWCSVGPRSAFPVLRRKRVYRTSWDEATWSITCFLVAPEVRGRGVASALAAAAAELAFSRGAGLVEGYPALSGKPLPAVFAWTGVAAVFENAGFSPDPQNPRVYRLTPRGV